MKNLFFFSTIIMFSTFQGLCQTNDSIHEFYGEISFMKATKNLNINAFQDKELKLKEDCQKISFNYVYDSLQSIRIHDYFEYKLDSLQYDSTYNFKHYIISRYHGLVKSKQCMMYYNSGNTEVLIARQRNHPEKILFIAYLFNQGNPPIFSYVLHTSKEETYRILAKNK